MLLSSELLLQPTVQKHRGGVYMAASPNPPTDLPEAWAQCGDAVLINADQAGMIDSLTDSLVQDRSANKSSHDAQETFALLMTSLP